MRHQVDSLLHVPPLIVAKAVRPAASSHFVMIRCAEKIELRRVDRVAVSVKHAAVDATVSADIGVTVAIPQHQFVSFARNSH